MHISAFAGNLPQRVDRPDHGGTRSGHARGSDPGSAAPAADQLSRDLRDQRNASMAWQILDRCVLRSEDSGDTAASVDSLPAAGAEDPGTSNTGGGGATAGTMPRSAAASTTELEYLGVQGHISGIQISDSGVQILEADLTYEHLVLRQTRQPVQKADPLMLDLDGDGLETTGVAGGVAFDLNADGAQDRVSVATGGDALLALDRNGNGRIDDGRELFGDQNGDANGFEALRRYDDNGDGLINRSDTVYSQLRLLSWNLDGTQQLQDLAAAGVDAIALDYTHSSDALDTGDSVAQRGNFIRSDGSHGEAADLLLSYEAAS
jgi:hypothetical protein